jgi:hypothetical protein
LTLHIVSDEGAEPAEILSQGVAHYYQVTLRDYRDRVVVALRRAPMADAARRR